MSDVAMAAGPTARESRSAAAQRGTRFRPDIEGLRAVAVGVVVLYHAGIGFVPGGFVGVDVFFVISGFLITGLLIREVDRTGRVSMTRFYARRARRLLPGASVVLVVTAMLMWLTASSVDRRTFGTDIVAAATYVENWFLAARSVDYLAEGTAASPVQHYWSLSVEEQFYVVWPLLLLVVVLVAQRRRWNIRAVMGAGLALIVLPSLFWSVFATATSPQTAYFITTTRLWELGAGALIAVTAGLWVKIPAIVARTLGWLGLAAIVGSALLFTSSTPWPGFFALLPVLGTAAVIVAGTADQRGAARLLGLRPMIWIGGLSYALYLWHWPLLITARNVFGEFDETVGLVVVLAAFVPAWLSTRYVENPIRFSRRLSASPVRTLTVGISLTVLAVVSGLLLMVAIPSTPSALGTAAARGGATLDYDSDSIDGVELSGTLATMTPAPELATEDLPLSSTDGCHRDFDAVHPEPCSIGAEDGDVTVVVVGDSKIQQWADALGEAARDRGWRMLLATKSSCGFHDGLRELSKGVPYVKCQEYNRELLGQLLELHPDAVITSQRHSTAYIPGTTEYSRAEMRDALTRTWTALERDGIDVIALVDNPSPSGVESGDGEIYKCVTEVEDLSDCAFDRRLGVEQSGAKTILAAAEIVPGVDVLDLTDAICNEANCPPVIGNVLVYRQGSHLTNTYVQSLQPILSARLAPLVKAASQCVTPPQN